jgi:hypothetical protein
MRVVTTERGLVTTEPHISLTSTVVTGYTTGGDLCSLKYFRGPLCIVQRRVRSPCESSRRGGAWPSQSHQPVSPAKVCHGRIVANNVVCSSWLAALQPGWPGSDDLPVT